MTSERNILVGIIGPLMDYNWSTAGIFVSCSVSLVNTHIMSVCFPKNMFSFLEEGFIRKHLVFHGLCCDFHIISQTFQ